MGMKILHTADWHIGSHKGPEKNGVNLRAEDTLKCLESMVKVAEQELPDLVLVSGDILDRAEIWQGRSHKEVMQARKIILDLSDAANHVIVMRGTPNHDSDGAFEELKGHFEFIDNVSIATEPTVIDVKEVSVAVLPGFDRDVFRTQHPGLSKEEENEVITSELGNIITGLKGMCTPGKTSILMSHYTVPGCNTESGQVALLTQFEPILPQSALNAADYDLVALGHIHRPQQVPYIKECFYSGAINMLNFNDEGQERGFWIHEEMPFGWRHEFYKTPYREFLTIRLSDTDISMINAGQTDQVGMLNWKGRIQDKIVRIIYSCSLENKKALNTALLAKELMKDGAFYVSDFIADNIMEVANRQDLNKATDPEENLVKWLKEKKIFEEDKIQELVLKARPIIARAEADESTFAAFGVFEPVEISVKNYRNYKEETFNFEDISFCTINGQNGAGKSSLFMDAIIDCLYEEPREGELTGWISSDEKARSGSIMFTFRIGEKMYRVTRTRAKSKKGTINLAEFVDGEWVGRSKEKARDTQEEIIKVLGMDSLTFKSCALIMQDQYGLFVQAKKEDRMAILSNLLGLGIYHSMESIARDQASSFKSQTKSYEKEIEIHDKKIKELGDPEEEIEMLNLHIASADVELKNARAERDKKNSELASMKDAMSRSEKIREDFDAVAEKRADVKKSMDEQMNIVSKCEEILKDYDVIRDGMESYKAADNRQNELSESATLYRVKTSEVIKVETDIKNIEDLIQEDKTKLSKEEENLANHQRSADDNDITAKAEEYKVKSAELDEMTRKAADYQTAKMFYMSVMYMKQDAESKYVADRREKTDLLNHLKKKVNIMKQSGCIDTARANCRFLQDAKEAEEQILIVNKEIDLIDDNRVLEIDRMNREVDDALKKMNDIGYDQEEHKLLKDECTILRGYSLKAESFKKKEAEIPVIQATIEHIKSNIADKEKRLMELKLECDRAKEEAEEYFDMFEEYNALDKEKKSLEHWIDRYNELPVIKERYDNSKRRLGELGEQLDYLSAELINKSEAMSEELAKCEGIPSKEEEIKSTDKLIEDLADHVRRMQIDLGAQQNKLSEFENLTCEISKLTREKNAVASESADYEILKNAFSQDGIPHQIVRTILPQLTHRANTILGQMTGGQMGVEFKTEKELQNGKEKVTLDIFIEEYGKAALPYLSKSGGEKVKASLSVILSLAEIKSMSAGVQLGMLFIDEPPFLDGDGIQAYCDALETIQRRYSNIKIMAITHDPTMKARFPQSIDIVKTDQGSKVIY